MATIALRRVFGHGNGMSCDQRKFLYGALAAILAWQPATRASEAATNERIAAHASDSEFVRIVVQRHNSQAPGQATRGTRGFETLRVKAAEADRWLKKYRAQSDVEFVALDRRKHRHAVPNDSLFAEQWYLQSAQPAAIGADNAWDTTTGSPGTVVAVLDTGVRFDHPDLARAHQSGKLLPGYDFISGDGGSTTQFLTANDGNGRDADPTDPGDWIDSNDRTKRFFANCELEDSSWHGTRVAGLLGAASNNGIGIAGVSWQSWILPVRVLGKCGGYDVDIVEAMRWAAGLPVSGVPNNPFPATIINLSLGSEQLCSSLYATTIQELLARGVVVVASGGNTGGPVGEPGNCPGVIAVAGLRHAGTKVGYSSLGPEIVIAAPAGNCVNITGACLFSLHTTYDTGQLTPAGPGYTDQFSTNLGTSFSSPLVAGVASLMHAVNARLRPQHFLARLKASARPFPDGGPTPPATCHVPTGPSDLQAAECVCTTTTCGAGMLNAPGAVAAALRPIAHVVTPASVTAGSLINLDGSLSSPACHRSLATYRWTVVSAQGTSAPVLSNADQATVQAAAPVSGSYVLRLTVMDDLGATDTGDVTVTSSSATSATIAPLPALTSGPSSESACPIVITPSQTPPPTQASDAAPPPAEEKGGGQLGIGLVVLLVALSVMLRRTHNAAQTAFKPSSSCRSS